MKGLDNIPVEKVIDTVSRSGHRLLGSRMKKTFLVCALSDPTHSVRQRGEAGKQSVFRVLTDKTAEFCLIEETVEKKLLRG